MKFDWLRKVLATLRGHDGREVGPRQCHSVGGQVALFLVQNRHSGGVFQVRPERFLELTDQPGIVPPPI